MLEKIVGKIELMPKVPKENQRLCDTCGGIGWLRNKEHGYIEKCRDCYDGIIPICPNCHNPVRGMCMNKECRDEREFVSEQKRIDKAIKAKYEDVPSDHKEMLYSDSYGYNEGYFSDIEDLIECCNDEAIDIPKHIWSTTKIGIAIDAEWILESACEELHESARDNLIDEKGLQEFLDAWCAKQTGIDTYMVDYKYAIEVSA